MEKLMSHDKHVFSPWRRWSRSARKDRPHSRRNSGTSTTLPRGRPRSSWTPGTASWSSTRGRPCEASFEGRSTRRVSTRTSGSFGGSGPCDGLCHRHGRPRQVPRRRSPARSGCGLPRRGVRAESPLPPRDCLGRIRIHRPPRPTSTGRARGDGDHGRFRSARFRLHHTFLAHAQGMGRLPGHVDPRTSRPDDRGGRASPRVPAGDQRSRPRISRRAPDDLAVRPHLLLPAFPSRGVADRKRLVELKARYEDSGKARALLAGSEHVGTYRQTDTYFALGERRLKLREIGGRLGALLIYYERRDDVGLKESEVL